MRIPPGRRSLAADRATAVTSDRPRAKRAACSRVEALETRNLLTTVGHILPPHPGTPQPTAQATAQAPIAPTDAPRVAYVQFAPLTGRVLVTFTGDLAGYSTATLTNPANYSLQVVKTEGKLPASEQSRPKAGVVLAPTFRVTGVAPPTPAAPGMPQTVVVIINNNQPIRNGVYRFAIHSQGITDLAGRPLDGRYSGTFPTGGNPPGGDFVADLVLTRNTVLPALPVEPQAGPGNPAGVAPGYVFLPSASAVRVRYTSATPGKFMLAGGNNITLVALANQHFPGTYRLPKAKPR